MEHLKGTIESVIYQNDDNGYSICDLKTENKTLETIVGTLPFISVGEQVDLVGTFVNHKEYGRQFKVESYEKLLPSTTVEMRRYLSSGAIKGVGAKIAEKMIEKFGEETFDVIANHPDWLTDIRGISRRIAKEISADFNEKEGVREIILFGKDRFSPAVALKLYQTYGKGAIDKIRQNPYSLYFDGNGIAFQKADEIALGLGFPTDHIERIRGGILYTFNTFAQRDGHTFLLQETLCDATGQLLKLPKDKIEEVLLSFKGGKELAFVKYKEEIRIYKYTSYRDEEYIAQKLIALQRKSIPMSDQNVVSLLADIEQKNHIQYADMQKIAIAQVLKNGVSVITGGPGTGKTTIIKALISIFEDLGYECALCAPTGRAAQRMSIATDHEASTIHRLLEFASDKEVIRTEPIFLRNEKNHLEQSVVIVDETSMVDVHLTASLLRAVKLGSRLVFIGDSYQLPSVGEGNVLADMIASNCFSVVKLTEIFRQSQNSDIVYNAFCIHEGKRLDLQKKSNDFFFIPVEDYKIPSYLANLCQNRLPKTYSFTVFDGIQVISPSRKGTCGTVQLNHTIQEAVNPPSPHKNEIVFPTKTFRENDKVMQIKNDYNLMWSRGKEFGQGIFNGDIGVIEKIEPIEGGTVITVNYDGKIAEYEETMLDELELAYAITVHKSQGSEFPIVVIPLSDYAPVLMTRNLIYTALTRAEQIVILLGNETQLNQMIDNEYQKERNTGLPLFLRYYDETARNS